MKPNNRDSEHNTEKKESIISFSRIRQSRKKITHEKRQQYCREYKYQNQPEITNKRNGK